MFSRKNELQSGSEYYDVLMSFIRSETKSGYISTTRSYSFIALRMFFLALSVTGLITFLYFSYSFTFSGNVMSLIMMSLCGFSFLVFFALFSLMPSGQLSWFECLDGKFDDESMIRLYRHGAPDDVIDRVIVSIGRTGTLTYAQLYDIFWVCSRKSDGSNRLNLLSERYKNIKDKMRARNINKGLI